MSRRCTGRQFALTFFVLLASSLVFTAIILFRQERLRERDAWHLTTCTLSKTFANESKSHDCVFYSVTTLDFPGEPLCAVDLRLTFTTFLFEPPPCDGTRNTSYWEAYLGKSVACYVPKTDPVSTTRCASYIESQSKIYVIWDYLTARFVYLVENPRASSPPQAFLASETHEQAVGFMLAGGLSLFLMFPFLVDMGHCCAAKRSARAMKLK